MPAVACIGSREVDQEEILFMERIGAYLARKGYIIKTGNAIGSDQAYTRGANRVNPTLVHLYLPWRTYEVDKIVKGNVVISDQEARWFVEAQKHHPNWVNLKDSVRKLMARNIGIVEGASQVIAFLNHSKPGGGGTGHGVRYALAHRIDVIDISTQHGWDRINTVMNKPE